MAITAAAAAESAEQARVVMIYGADSRIGRKLVQKFEEKQQSILPRSTDFFEDAPDVAKAIHNDIRSKKPSVVVNCMIDPDAGFMPRRPVKNYLAPAHAMTQRCRTGGIRLIHCSSAQVYGQAEVLQGRQDYHEYDPAMCVGYNVWRPVLHSVEASIWQQTSLYNTAPILTTHPSFELYVLRLGHMIDDEALRFSGEMVDDHYTLDQCLREATIGDAKDNVFTCVSPEHRISPISTSYAADCVVSLCKSSAPAPSGTYNIGPESSVTLNGFFHHLSVRASRCLTLQKKSSFGPQRRFISGIDANQSLDSNYASIRLRLTPPDWKDAIDSVLSGSRMVPVI